MRVPYKFLIAILVFFVGAFIIEHLDNNFMMNDFKVYYSGARALAAGKPLYDTLFTLGSGYYKYSPFIALLFYPLSLFSYSTACILYFVSMACAFIMAGFVLSTILQKHFPSNLQAPPNSLLLLAFFCISTHMVRELLLGNVNAILLLSLCSALYFILRKKHIHAGVLIALVIITKPFFCLILLPVFLRKYYKTILTTLLCLAAFMLIPAIFIGLKQDILLHKEWYSAIMEHAEAFPSTYTIESLLRTYVYLGLSAHVGYIVFLLVVGAYSLFVWSNRVNPQKESSQNYGLTISLEWFLMLALLPSLFNTDSEHFLMTLPLIMLILTYLFTSRNLYPTILFVLMILAYGGNSSDLLGRSLSLKITNLGILGISNLAIIAIAIYTYSSYLKQEKVLSSQA